MHKSNKTFKCDQCTHSACSNFDLHVKAVHDKIKDFLCIVCEHASSVNSDLLKHIRHVHLEIIGLFCSECAYAATSFGLACRISSQEIEGFGLH